ncbi:hypothetical protein DLP05_015 [Stenotrophomonas phage vB_SmaS_DLP_5]|uniref:Uncharacterized protein n=1 Tax=Stenotrophomonas phage vB_SmaS_DLP_5 TaxID=2044561 RepID=A0A2D2W2E0_9CAUD|nr:major tail protein with Ig-like domain [Stenotrophomonas phage vB_SmaS_DLP_5]ATS92314.1 hypothetical protein DLP05_015 [Stenotrophomonas phage vB_SmaS_DLP_5]
MYFSGQGKVYIAERDSVTGRPGAFRFVGNVPELRISMSVDNLEHKESMSGSRLTDLRITREKTCELAFTLEDFSVENLSLGMYGATTELSGATVTAEPLPAGLKAGDYVRLDNPNVSSLVVKDGSATPVTLVEGTDYRVESAAFGTIQILTALTGKTQPLTAAYTSTTGGKSVNMFSAPSKERWIRFEGLNTADENKPVLVELYRTTLDPMSELSLISDDLLKLELSGAVLYDQTKIANAALGQFGRVVML